MTHTGLLVGFFWGSFPPNPSLKVEVGLESAGGFLRDGILWGRGEGRRDQKVIPESQAVLGWIEP